MNLKASLLDAGFDFKAVGESMGLDDGNGPGSEGIRNWSARRVLCFPCIVIFVKSGSGVGW